jgi:PleD family two-component response regulator
LLAITRDITERKQHQKLQEEIKQKLETQLAEITELQLLLQEQTVRDPLTGLNNRRYLDETLPRELSRAKREGHPLALIMIDLDHFKKINDIYGH